MWAHKSRNGLASLRLTANFSGKGTEKLLEIFFFKEIKSNKNLSQQRLII